MTERHRTPSAALPDDIIPNRRQALENWRARVPYGETGWCAP